MMNHITKESMIPASHLIMSHMNMSPEIAHGEKSNKSTSTGAGTDQIYLEGLIRERDSLGSGPGMDLTRKLLNQEIERIQNGGKIHKNDDKKMNDVTKDKSIKLTVKVLVPVKDHPKFNFVGKLLGPKGNSLKRLQEETMTKMAILGRGSIRDKQKEEELRISGDQKFHHLSEDLHVEIAAMAPPAEAHARIAYALTEIRRYLVPDYNDDIRQEQMREIQRMQTSNNGDGETSSSPGASGVVGGISGADPDSPASNGGEKPQQIVNGDGKKNAKVFSSIMTSHPAFRGVPRNHDQSVKDNSFGSKPRTNQNAKRSVLAMLTKSRALQQKEQDYMGVFHEVPSFNVYDHLGEISSCETTDDMAGRNGGGAIKVTANNSERGRFRHDPYPRIASN